MGSRSAVGLIEQQDAGLERQRPRQSHALLHSTGNIGGHLLQVALHAHAREQFADAIPPVGRRQSCVAPQRKRYVFFNGQ